MKFLCDVHISYKVMRFLKEQGHECSHVNYLPRKSETADVDICAHADKEDCIIVTKDADFLDYYFLRRTPRKIVKINLGNVATDELILILKEALPLIARVQQRQHFLIELDKDGTYTVDQSN